MIALAHHQYKNHSWLCVLSAQRSFVSIRGSATGMYIRALDTPCGELATFEVLGANCFSAAVGGQVMYISEIEVRGTVSLVSIVHH